MSDHTQADAGRERDPIPTARESDQDRQALSAPVDESASAHADPPAGAPALPRSAAGLRLDAWRERGADRMDPVRFRFMEALERRAAPHAGAARALLDQRLAALLDAYAADLEQDEAAPGSPAPEPSQAPGREAQDCAAADTPIDAPCPPTPWPAWPARSTPATPCPGAAPTRAAAAGRVPRYLGQGQCQPPAAPIGTAGARQCRPAQFQQPGPPLAGADAPALARLSAPVPVLPGRAGLDGAVRWRGGRCQEAARGSAKAGAKGAGKAAKPAAAKRSRAKTA